MKKMLRHTLLACIGLMSAAPIVSADEYPQYQEYSEYQEFPAYDTDCCYEGTGSGCNWDGLSLAAGWLYWKTEQDNLEIGTDHVEFAPGETDDRAKVLRPEFKFSSGFWIGLGYELPCTAWELSAAFTYMPSSARVSRFIPNSVAFADGEFIVLSARDLPILGTEPYADVRAKWRSHTEWLDLDISRRFCLTGNISLRPHVGVRIAWMRQALNVDAVDPGIVEMFRDDFRLKQTFAGGGVEAGLWADWHIGCGFSLVGHFGGAALYSRYRTTQVLDRAAFPSPNSPPMLFHRSITGTVLTGTAMIDTFLGVQYDTCAFNSLWNIRLGWEQHILVDANQWAGRGNLSLQGLTLSTGVTF